MSEVSRDIRFKSDFLDLAVATATLNPLGAIMTSFVVNGQNILTPVYDDNGSPRGGSFWAEPFGPESPEPGARKHGLLRINEWISDPVDPTMLRFTDSDRGLSYELKIWLHARRQAETINLGQRLIISNSTDDYIRIAPAMHPYFNMTIDEALKQRFLADRLITRQSVAKATEFMERGVATEFSVGGYAVSLSSDMPRRTIWTPTDGRSVCVEPSLVGQTFAKQQPPVSEDEILHPKEFRSFSSAISVKIPK